MSETAQLGHTWPRLAGVLEEFERRYQAVRARDRHYDGRFVSAATSTGTYCRPSCSVQPPSREDVRFYLLPAAAQAAGFRACTRCRPDATPGVRDWDVRADLVARTLALVEEGAVDTDGVAGVARRVGLSERHLNRLLVEQVGCGPLALARTRRAQTARMLVESSALPLAEVAYAAGYGSVRQFTDGFREAFGVPPSALRRAGAASNGDGTIALRLRHRVPYDKDSLLRFLAARAVPELEQVVGGTYRRALRLPRGTGIAEVTPYGTYVRLRLRLSDLRDLTAAVRRTRRLFDLDADPEAVDAALGRDAALAPLVRARPGVRVPGAVDGFELAVRAVLGQQVSVAAARTLAGRLVARYGAALSTVDGEITRAFPTATAIAAADLSELGMPASRLRTLRALAVAVATGEVVLDAGADRVAATEGLLALPGVGPWTVAYVAMRALGDPDAFPATDLGLRRAAERLGVPDLAARAEAWRPWRAYAAMQLWAAPP